MTARTTRVLLTSALAALFCCGGLDTFEISQGASTTIQGASVLETLAGDMGFGGFLNMNLSQSQELQNQGVEKKDIDSVRLTGFTLTITEPASGQDFTFLQSLEFYVEADGQPRKRIARGGPFPQGANRVDLSLDDVELAPYVAADAMSITTEVNGRRPAQDTTLQASMRLQVDVNVSGAVCGE